MGLEFEHRPSDSPLIERVWRSRSSNTTTMVSVARACWDFVFWEGSNGVQAGVQGPESRASQAPVPAGADFLGVRLALGTFLAELPASLLVDRFVEFPVDGNWFHLVGERVQMPQFAEAEEFVAHLVRTGLLVVADVRGVSLTERTRQRRYLAGVGLPQRTVLQIQRAQEAALRIGEGQRPAVVAQETGYFDQPHLARSLRRFVGLSATDLAMGADRTIPMSLLYKTGERRDR